jgi:N-acyl-D-aspartate/D-glutamate deacylase
MWLRTPHMVVGSDAMPPVDADGNYLTGDDPYEKYSGHPRTAGSFATVLRLARENDVALMHTLSQTSYWSAKHLGDAGIEAMKGRGRMQVGMVADITIFDPENVTERSTYKAGENGLPSAGIPYVLVRGTIVVKDSKVQNVYPGQPIRYPVEAKGRFKPLERSSYIKGILGVDYVDLDHHALGKEDVYSGKK